MKVEIRPATLRDLCWTAANAREIDKREIIASGPSTMQECGVVTWHVLEQCGGAGFCVWLDDSPEYAFGLTRQTPMAPWRFDGWAWGSEKTALCMPAMGRWGATELIPLVDRLGLTRCEARSIVGHTEAHRWLRWMGFERECELVDWGRNGTRFVQFAWTRGSFSRGASKHVHGLKSAAAASGVAKHDRPRESGTGDAGAPEGA